VSAESPLPRPRRPDLLHSRVPAVQGQATWHPVGLCERLLLAVCIGLVPARCWQRLSQLVVSIS
jgi:hypothetical protein